MEAPKMDAKMILNRFGVGVESECGQLDIVVMHRPGRELLRLNKHNLHHLLYDALPNIHETHRSHDIFANYLREHGVQVLYFGDLLRDTLVTSDQARRKLIDGLIRYSHLNDEQAHPHAATALRNWLLERTSKQLVDDTIAGVACTEEELGTTEHARALLDTAHLNDQYVIKPLPNLLFMRDGFSIIEKYVFIWQMNKSARRNEPFLLRLIFEHHPDLSTSSLKIVDWQMNRDHNNNNLVETPTIEGGDVAYLGDGVVLIGCSERTNRAAIEAVARTRLFRLVIAVTIPPRRYYMHLDTVLSTVGAHAFTLHGPLAETMEIFTVENARAGPDDEFTTEWVSHGCDVRQALRKLLDDPELIFYDAVDEETSVHDQRHCRHNVVVLNDNHVVTYAGSDTDKSIVAQMTRNDACRVGPIPFQGLWEGGGGVHCMTNAIRRRRRQ